MIRSGRVPRRESHGEATYFLTFTTYGTRLPGDDRGSTDSRQNTYTMPRESPNQGLHHVMKQPMTGPPVVLSQRERALAHETIRALSKRRNWFVHALNIRTNHLRAVVWSDEPPLQVIQSMKAWVTRAFRDALCRERGETIWTRGGSRQYLWDEMAILRAVDYVLFLQD